MGASLALGKLVKHCGRDHLRKYLMVQFSEYVLTITKRYFHSDVSLLLTAAFHASGDDRTITPESLKMLRKRHPEMLPRRPHLLGIGGLPSDFDFDTRPTFPI